MTTKRSGMTLERGATLQLSAFSSSSGNSGNFRSSTLGTSRVTGRVWEAIQEARESTEGFGQGAPGTLLDGLPLRGLTLLPGAPDFTPVGLPGIELIDGQALFMRVHGDIIGENAHPQFSSGLRPS